MRLKLFFAALLAPLVLPMSQAQDADAPLPFPAVDAAEDVGAIALYDGAAPGSESTGLNEIWRDAGTERWVTNVTQPTLLPVLPEDPAKTRAAVIVIPGGGFQFVSIDNEGYPIAEWLAERGIAAFILKYRTMPVPEDQAEYAAYMSAFWSPPPGEERIDVTPGIPIAVADAQAALNLVQARSDEWGFDADKIGMVGFSAGAMTTLGVTLAAEDSAPKPAFIGNIYGPMTRVDVPQDAPPMFVALAADDPLFAGQGFGIVEAWQAAGIPVEFHYYQNGGHGFGSYKRGATADAWFDQLVGWMKTSGWLEAAKANGTTDAD